MKKGFTLAELIGVIVVLALIALVAVPSVADVLSKNKKKLCEVQMENIISAARSWGANNLTILPNDNGDTKTITLKDLQDGGYIDKGITNPLNNTPINENMRIRITRDNKKYKYQLMDGSSEINISEFCNNK